MTCQTEKMNKPGVRNNLDTLYTKDKDTDMIIQIGEDFIRTHKHLLCKCSPYFEAMFSGLYRESDDDQIDMSHTIHSKVAFGILLDYMYSGKLKIEDDILEDLVDVSSILLLDECKMKCSTYMRYNLDAKNALRFWLIIYRYFDQYLPMYQNILDACFHNLHIYEDEIVQLSSCDMKCLLASNVHKHCSVEQMVMFLLRWFKASASCVDMESVLSEIPRAFLKKVMCAIIDQNTCRVCHEFVKLIRGAIHQSDGDILRESVICPEGSVITEDSHATCGKQESRTDEDDTCLCNKFQHFNALKELSDHDIDFDVLIIAGPSYETLNHKFDLFSHNKKLRTLKTDSVEFLDISVYIPSSKTWLSIGGMPCPHETLKLSVDFMDRDCSIHYLNGELYFRKRSKEVLRYNLYERNFRGVTLTDLDVASSDDSIKLVGSFVVDNSFYCFVTNNITRGDAQVFKIVKLIKNQWVVVLDNIMPFPSNCYVTVFDVVTMVDEPQSVYVMLITKSSQIRSLFSGHIFKLDMVSMNATYMAELGEFLVEPFHWNFSKQKNVLHLLHKATVMYTLDLESSNPVWHANETQVCLSGYLPSMKNSRCGQIVCQSLFAPSRRGLWIIATRKVRGKLSVGCLNHVDLSQMPDGCVEEQTPPPYSIFTFMIPAKMPVQLLRRFREARLYHKYSIWE